MGHLVDDYTCMANIIYSAKTAWSAVNRLMKYWNLKKCVIIGNENPYSFMECHGICQISGQVNEGKQENILYFSRQGKLREFIN